MARPHLSAEVELGKPVRLDDPWTVVAPVEFRARVEAAREATRAAGCEALLVVSRGGGTSFDMCADVLYLTNHYSQQPYVGDEVRLLGAARSHGVLIVPVDGGSILVVDTPWWRRDLVVADDVRESERVTDVVIAELRARGIDRSRVAISGLSYMSASTYLSLREGLPDVEIVRADRMIEKLRIRKSAAEIALIRESTAVASDAMDALMKLVVAGVTEADVAAEASRFIIEAGGVVGDVLCASGPHSHQYFHARLPSADPHRPLVTGDIFHVDLYGAYGGYVFDFARTRVVGDDPTSEQRALLDTVIDCVEMMSSELRPGMTAADLCTRAAEFVASSPAASASDAVVPQALQLVGHGLGLMWEAPWLVPGESDVIEPGTYLALEFALTDPAIGGAFFEHNGLVTNTGFTVLTQARARWG